CGMQTMREIAHALADVLRAVEYLSERIAAASHQLQVDLQHRELLADVVVQFARDSRALGLLCLQEPRAKIADSVITGAQRRLAVANLPLSLPSPRALHQ